MPWLRTLRLAFRSVLRTPGFTIVAVLTLALGVGTTSSIFSIANGTMLNPLPWGDPETIVSVDVHRPKHDDALRDLSYGQFFDLQREARSYSALAAIQFELAYMNDRDDAYMVTAPRVTPNAFEVARVKPLFGRAFDDRDGRPEAEPVAMMSEQLWKDRYGADPSIIGRKLEIDGEQTTVIGITASARWFPYPSASVLRPLIFTTQAPSREGEPLGVVGRLNSGVTVQQAQLEVDLLAERLAQQYPTSDGNLRMEVQLTRDTVIGSRNKAGTLFLMAAVGFVLLIVCANVAGLLLARAAGREKEIATRAALGATRLQLVAQLLAECAALALLALPVALAVTWLCRDYMLSLVPANVTYMREFFRIDGAVLAFAVLTTGTTVLLFGLHPALQATRVDLNTALKSGGHRGSTGSGTRLRSTLVVAQIGLAVSLLATSALFMDAFAKVQTVDPGFETDGLLLAEVSLPDARYREPDKMREFQQRLSSAVADLPGGSTAGLVSVAPFGWEGGWREFQVAGRETAAGEEAPRSHWASASPTYFSTLGLRVLAGRVFTAADTTSSQRVVVITKSLADKYFPGEDPLGRRIELKRGSSPVALSTGVREIIGVVSDVKSLRGLDAPIEQPRIYEPTTQQPTPTFSIVVRSRGEISSISALVRQRMRSLDPLLGVTQIETMDIRFDRAIWQGRLFIRLMNVLGGLALVLAAIGVYGVVSYTTGRRTREFGIRMAIGAEPWHVAQIVLRKTLALACWGAVLGVALALLSGMASQQVLYDSTGQDPLTLAGVLAVLILVLLGATAVPTLRATLVNPADCLRAE